MRTGVRAYSHNRKVIGMKKAMQTPTATEFLVFKISQIGKMNVAYLSRER
jgi:hypothetical protein